MARRDDTRRSLFRPWIGAPWLLVVLTIGRGSLGGELPAAPSPGDKLDYAADVGPILAAHCYQCHGPEKQEGGIRWDRRTSVLAGGDSGQAALVPGNPGGSELFRRISTSDDDQQMPPPGEGKPLSAVQIAALRQWIVEGAVWPQDSAEPAHWSYVRPRRPALPDVKQKDWPQTSIDHFVLARLEAKGLKPSPAADPARLLRRVYLDLIGLPPSPEEVTSFLEDPSDRAYEETIDRLLASPRYGEKWARHWLDLARYSDSNGYQADQIREMWAYRDWVIEALNADMPFDQFTIEQVAGDLLPKSTVAQKIATGFHRTPTCNVEAGVDPEENRTNQVIDRVNTTATVWLGSTIECAQCHNHKYDPFTQKEYYQLYAFFNNSPLEVKNGDGKGVQFDFYGPKMDIPLTGADGQRYENLRQQRNQQQQALDQAIANAEAKQPAWEARLASENSAPSQTHARHAKEQNIARILAKPADQRDEKARKTLRAYYLGRSPEINNLRAQITKLTKQLDAIKPASTLVMVEMDKPRASFIFKRGVFLDKGLPVRPDVPAVLHDFPADAPRNRLGLARWLVDPQNPLVARVVVNRWWEEIFGRGLVRTTEDFGTQGDPPSHPQLLDWLAVELVHRGWSMKSMHKLIVMSSTYRQSARVTPQLLANDFQNNLLARGPRFRLPAETIRDNALQISGLLSLTMGGPPVYPPQPARLWNQTGRNEPKYVVQTDDNRYRRGIYVVWRRAAPYPSFVNFDAPDRMRCVVSRPTTNTPLQALTLLNDEAYVECAKALAARVITARPDANLQERIGYAVQLCVARPPTLVELRYLEGVYKGELEQFTADPAAARALIGGFQLPGAGPMPKNVNEWAAWFCVANILLNLDETISKG